MLTNKDLTLTTVIRVVSSSDKELQLQVSLDTLSET